MSEQTAKLALPLLAASQAQKHVTHNEALTVLDTLCQASVIDKDLTTPPGSPAEGDCYIVAATATGAWTGWEKRVARFIDGTWRSYIPNQGWLVYVLDEAALYTFNGASWVGFGSASFQPLDADLTAIAGLSPSNDDVIQRKAGAWANRTMAQLMADLGVLGQIPFPATQNASSDPNTLDDYEEGTWTPILTASTTPPTGVTYTADNLGRYTKIGNLVSVWANFRLTSKGSGGVGNAQIGGLPFTVASPGGGMFAQGGVFAFVTLDAGYSWAAVTPAAGAAVLNLIESGSNITQAFISWANLANTSRVIANAIYFV